METQILLAEDLDLIEKGELDTLQKDIAEIERMLKALIKSLENKPLNPGPLESLDPLLQLNWRRTKILYIFKAGPVGYAALGQTSSVRKSVMFKFYFEMNKEN